MSVSVDVANESDGIFFIAEGLHEGESLLDLKGMAFGRGTMFNEGMAEGEEE